MARSLLGVRALSSPQMGGGGYSEEEALFDFFEADVNSDLLFQDGSFFSYITGSLSYTPWAVKAKGGEFVDMWRLGTTLPFLGHGGDPVAVMFKCGKGEMNTESFFDALKPISASEFYSGEIELSYSNFG